MLIHVYKVKHGVSQQLPLLHGLGSCYIQQRALFLHQTSLSCELQHHTIILLVDQSTSAQKWAGLQQLCYVYCDLSSQPLKQLKLICWLVWSSLWTHVRLMLTSDIFFLICCHTFTQSCDAKAGHSIENGGHVYTAGQQAMANNNNNKNIPPHIHTHTHTTLQKLAV